MSNEPDDLPSASTESSGRLHHIDPDRALDERLLLPRSVGSDANDDNWDDSNALRACLDLLENYRQLRGVISGSDRSWALPTTFGRFEVLQELGRGGFGVVFRAHDPELGRDIALKLPRPDCLWTEELRQRFLYEGQIAGRLDHPHIVPVYQAGMVEQTCYLVAAYVAGPTLAEWLDSQASPLSCNEAAKLVEMLAEAVEHAHRRGVLHRDLKPSNILMDTADAIPRITDFGLARLQDRDGESLTQTGVLLGTPDYMAPEQAAGDSKRIGTQTDIYALGVILYELLTRKRPFDGASRAETLQRVIHEPPPSPRLHRADIPRDLESICLKCLNKDPNNRYRTASEFADELRRFQLGLPVNARPRSIAQKTILWARRKPTTAALMLALLLGSVISIVGVGWHLYEVEHINESLRHAVDDGNRQRMLVQDRERRARALAHTGQVRIAYGLWENGQTDSICEVLDQLRPRADEGDPREFAWRYLWNQGLNDQRIRGHRNGIVAIDVDDRGRLYSVDNEGTIYVWDTHTGRHLQSYYQLITGSTEQIAVSPDGSRLAAVFCENHSPIRVWDLSTKRMVSKCTMESDCLVKIRFLNDNRTIVYPRHPHDERKGTMVFWNTESNDLKLACEDFYQGKSISISKDRTIIAVGCELRRYAQESAIILLNHKGEKIGQLPTVGGLITNIAFSDDTQRLACYTSFGELMVWKIPNGTPLYRRKLTDHLDEISDLTFLDDGSSVGYLFRGHNTTTSILRSIKIDNNIDMSLEEELVHGVWLFGPILESNRMIIWTDRHTLRVFRKSGIPSFLRLTAHSIETWGIAFTPDGKSIITTSDDHTVIIWDAVSWQKRHVLTDHRSLVSCVAMAHSGDWFATGSFDGTIKIWEVATGKLLRDINASEHPIRAIDISQDDGMIAWGNTKGLVGIWNVLRSEMTRSWNLLTDRKCRTVRFTSDGNRLLVGSENMQIVIHEIAGESSVILDHIAQVCDMILLHDDQELLIAGSDGKLQLRNLDTGTTKEFPGGHNGPILAVTVSPDGKTIASAGEDQSVRLWHIDTGIELCNFRNLKSVVRDVAFSPDGTSLIAAMHNGDILRWDAPPAPPR